LLVDACLDVGGFPQGEGSDCLTPCPEEPPRIDAVHSIAFHDGGVQSELPITITPDFAVETREPGIHLLEIEFNREMDPTSCEDLANISITGTLTGPHTTLSASLTDTTLRIDLSPLPDADCYVFDLTGMLSTDFAPVENPTFEIAALVADVNADLLVDPTDFVALSGELGFPPTAGTVQYDLNVDGLIDTVDVVILQARYDLTAPACPD
jgi:hypothetical protein